MSEVVDRVRVFGEVAGEIERIAPGFFPKPFEAEHLARYRWASRYVTGLRVLDVACGTGYGAEVLRARGAREVVSVDVSPDALNFGRRRYSLRAVRADAEALPFPPETFDAVVSLETIEHLEDPRTFLKEAATILRPGGVLLLSTPNPERSSRVNPYHLNEMLLPQLVDLCRAARFCPLRVLGQQWRLRGSGFERIKGLRRFAWLLQSRSFLWNLPLAIAQPRYWCLRLRRTL